jgi:hypothetical protein
MTSDTGELTEATNGHASESNQTADGRFVIDFDGRKFTVPKITLRDFNAVAALLLQKRRMEILRLAAAVYENFPRDIADAMCRAAWDDAIAIREIPPGEVAKWVNTNEGLAFVMYTLIAKVDPDRYTLGQIEQIIGNIPDDRLAQLCLARDQIERQCAVGDKYTGTAPTGN